MGEIWKVQMVARNCTECRIHQETMETRICMVVLVLRQDYLSGIYTTVRQHVIKIVLLLFCYGWVPNSMPILYIIPSDLQLRELSILPKMYSYLSVIGSCCLDKS